MALMVSALDARGLTLYLFTPKSRYSVSVHSKNYFYTFTFKPDAVSFYNNFHGAVIWSVKSFLVTTNTLSIYARTILDPLKSSDIFSRNISGLLQTPIVSFWYSQLPHRSKIVQSCLDPGGNSI